LTQSEDTTATAIGFCGVGSTDAAYRELRERVDARLREYYAGRVMTIVVSIDHAGNFVVLSAIERSPVGRA